MAQELKSAIGKSLPKPSLANRIMDSDSHKPAQDVLDKALFDAISKSSCEEIQTLLAKGADPNSLDGKTNTPLMNAISPHIRDRMDIIELLVSHGADVNILRKDGKFTALMIAGQIGDYEICKFLLEHGADPNAKKNDGTTALMMSTRDERVCEMMLDHGAKVNSRSKVKYTALLHAALMGYSLSCELLIKRGAHINARDEFNRTPLMLAAHGGHAQACKVLLKHGANHLIKNSYDGKTAYEMAMEKQFPQRDFETILVLFIPIAMSSMLGKKMKMFMNLFRECISTGV